MSKPCAAISLMPQEEFRLAVEPLIEEGLLDAAEWSFDIGWKTSVPDWLDTWLDRYEQSRKLYGHGVNYSAFSMVDNPKWLDRFESEVSGESGRKYALISEHYGFVKSRLFDDCAPMPVPYAMSSIDVATRHLTQLRSVYHGAVGLENLAFAFSREDMVAQGSILTETLERADGFMVLDVHNLYCQMHNFEMTCEDLMALYPCDRVRVVHVSGGSWTAPDTTNAVDRKIRRDTHDDDVPEEVFALLPKVLKRCTNTEVVVLERLGNTLKSDTKRERFRQDFLRMREILNQDLTSNVGESAGTAATTSPQLQISEEELLHYQDKLLQSLYYLPTQRAVKSSLLNDPKLAALSAYFESFEYRMIAVAQELVRKWSVIVS